MSEGRPFLSIQPERLYKLRTSYDFGAAGHGGGLSGLRLSGGVNVENILDKTYYESVGENRTGAIGTAPPRNFVLSLRSTF
ncbi:hypothetical protein ACFPN2_12165 [Steroidobacter flavus]|uniref:TonB-dependent receptor-like beta-barrel domain-containing protein n=1 Tax=Steroidobacter flavus TaxID=1842136 RepID=A0ABV8SSC1_9GAMM